jgi:hypothetical protein
MTLKKPSLQRGFHQSLTRAFLLSITCEPQHIMNGWVTAKTFESQPPSEVQCFEELGDEIY